MNRGRRRLRRPQFAVSKPLLTFVALVLEWNGAYEQGSFDPRRGYVYISVILNVSITYAFYELVLFYIALKVRAPSCRRGAWVAAVRRAVPRALCQHTHVPRPAHSTRTRSPPPPSAARW
jgi:hypothetical protein